MLPNCLYRHISIRVCFVLYVALILYALNTRVFYLSYLVYSKHGQTLVHGWLPLTSLTWSRSFVNGTSQNDNIGTGTRNRNVEQPPTITTSPAMAQVAERFLERRERMRVFCSKYKKPMTEEERQFVMTNIMVDDFHRLLYCPVPKASSSSWKNTLLFLVGRVEDIEKVSSPQRQTLFRRLSSCKPNERALLLKNYRKMMVSREPLSRFISCYRDKFLHVNTKHRRDLCKQVVKHVTSLGQHHTRDALNVSISEFAEYAHHTANWTFKAQHHLNLDWRPMITMCQPCHFDYDYNADVTTIGKDSRYILKMIGAPDSLNLQQWNPSGNTSESDQHVMESYLSQMPASLIKRVVDIYKRDYEIFDYKPAQGTHFEKLFSMSVANRSSVHV